MKAVVAVRFKDEVPDSEGKIILDRVHSMGLSEVRGVKAGRLFEIDIEGGEIMSGDRIVKEICNDLLVNAAIEEFEILSITG
jgi:phosphoribosylformylglycinamidine synthase PurS subunit